MVGTWKGLTDQYGRPIEKRTLSEEIATPELMGVRRVAEDREASGLTPERLARILIEAQNGEARAYLTLAEEMEERYLHYASQLQTRRLAIETLDASVEAEGMPTKIVDFVHELIADPEFDELVGHLTDGLGKGYSVCEILWDYRDGKLRPSYVWRDPRFFRFDRKDLTTLRLEVDGTFEGAELAPAKFVVHKPRTKAGIPLRRGLARPAAWAFLIQSFGLKDWSAFAEIYGIPWRIGKYHSNASEKDKRTLLRAVRSLASDAAAIMPQGMEIDIQELSGNHGAAVFGGLLDYVDRQVSKVVIGQTMTADDGSSMAQAKIHNEVRLDLRTADAKQMAATVNREVIQVAVALNFGPQAVYPTAQFPVAEPEDIEALSKAVDRLVRVGLRVGQSQVREKIGLSDPSEGDELLVPPRMESKPAALSYHGVGCQCPGCRPARLAASTDAVPASDPLEELLREEDFEAVSEDLLEPLRAILEHAETLEEARSMLSELERDGLDTDLLMERLATLTSISRGLGDISDS
ncbi:DUF935 domain-containing protein [Breoghania sp.]|uniref:DUF935 domain-containing protein n=1 Tax=Breoghania sp. TaxID=2065378 RepID=UPI0029CA0D5F|nr:DUF935 domain-containing protein [Breoghania sp.]